MTGMAVPLVDLMPWFYGTGREAVARQIDDALQDA